MALPHKEFEAVFSQWVRLSRADWKGFTECFTCGEVQYWKYLQDGHFIPRVNMILKYHPDNNRPQCNNCNCLKNGNLKVFRKKLIKELGLEKVEELELLKHSTYKYSQSEMRELIKCYKEKVKELHHSKTIA